MVVVSQVRLFSTWKLRLLTCICAVKAVCQKQGDTYSPADVIPTSHPQDVFDSIELMQDFKIVANAVFLMDSGMGCAHGHASCSLLECSLLLLLMAGQLV